MNHGLRRMVLAAGLAVAGSCAAGEPEITPAADADSLQARASRELESAVNRAKAWIVAGTDKVSGAGSLAEARTREWFERARRELIGDPTAPRVHGTFHGRVVNATTGLAESTGGGNGSQHDLAVNWINVSAMRGVQLPKRLVVLVHGLDEPGEVWNDLFPELARNGFAFVKFDYPNDGPIGDSADLLGESLRDLKARGVEEVDFVCHSMGGLVVRDVLTRESWYNGDADAGETLPDVGRFVMLATPNRGALLAPLQPLTEAREQIARTLDKTAHTGAGLLHSRTDGCGEAATDLAQDSAFLKALNERPLPRNVKITCVVASIVDIEDRTRLAQKAKELCAMLGIERSKDVDATFKDVVGALGDGLVTVDSAKLPPPAESIVIRADHRSVIRHWHVLDGLGVTDPTPHELPEGVRIVMERLLSDRAESR